MDQEQAWKELAGDPDAHFVKCNAHPQPRDNPPIPPILPQSLAVPAFDLVKPEVLGQSNGMQFENVTAVALGNVYFEGQVISHTIISEDGSKKTLGVILPGTFHFDTAAAEHMEIISGNCEVVIEGTNRTETFRAGTSFDVPGESGFTITVTGRPCHYVCSFL